MPESLLSKDTNVLNHQASTSSKTETDPEVSILLAEDNTVNQKLAAFLFQKLGHSIKIVTNGKEAVEEALNNDYDLIFMDIQMPEMDGLEATRLLKRTLGTNCPSIIALTANAMNGDRERVLQAGMDDYIAKPLTYATLRETIYRYAFS